VMGPRDFAPLRREASICAGVRMDFPTLLSHGWRGVNGRFVENAGDLVVNACERRRLRFFR
jgi:hypothetical protein